jgi:hypothetical protein
MHFYFKKLSFVMIFFVSGCMHYYQENNKFPLLFDVKTIKENGNIRFISLSKHNIDNFVFSGIRVDKTDNKCDDSTKSHLSVVWHHYLKETESMPRLSTPIQYGTYEKGEKLKTNLVYSVEVQAKRILNNKFTGKLGFGYGLFVITDTGKLISAYTYSQIKALCNRYSQ